MSRTQSLGDLSADAQHFLHRQPSPRSLQPIFERLALEQLHGQKGNAAILAHLINGDDMLMLDGGGQLCLAQETPMELGVGRQRRLHHLERRRPFELGVFRLKNDSHRARSQNLANKVSAKAAQLVRSLGWCQKVVVRGRSRLGKSRHRVLRVGRWA